LPALWKTEEKCIYRGEISTEPCNSRRERSISDGFAALGKWLGPRKAQFYVQMLPGFL
jgi:hypothetical protein